MEKILFKDYFKSTEYTYTANMKVKIKKNDFNHEFITFEKNR